MRANCPDALLPLPLPPTYSPEGRPTLDPLPFARSNTFCPFNSHLTHKDSISVSFSATLQFTVHSTLFLLLSKPSHFAFHMLSPRKLLKLLIPFAGPRRSGVSKVGRSTLRESRVADCLHLPLRLVVACSSTSTSPSISPLFSFLRHGQLPPLNVSFRLLF